MIAFSSDEELIMGLSCMKDKTFLLYIKGELPFTLKFWIQIPDSGHIC